VCCRGTKCPLLTAFFFLSLLYGIVTFLPEGVFVGFPNFAWGFKSQKKISFGVKKILIICHLGGRLLGVFSEKNEKYLE
jgi:hypothetical protein